MGRKEFVLSRSQAMWPYAIYFDYGLQTHEIHLFIPDSNEATTVTETIFFVIFNIILSHYICASIWICEVLLRHTSGSVCSIPTLSGDSLSSPETSCACTEPDKKPCKQRLIV